MTGFVVNTARALRWGPPAIVVGVGVVSGAALRLGGTGAMPSMAALMAGAMAATVALSLDDPAHALLAAVPIGPRRQAVLRVAISGPVALAGWLLFQAADPRDTAAAGGLGVPALLALIGAGVATAMLVRPRRPDAAAAAGAAVALGWALAPVVLGRGMLYDVTTAWARYPWAVLAGAAVVITVDRRR